jgi:hypothetical protein
LVYRKGEQILNVPRNDALCASSAAKSRPEDDGVC